LARDGARAAGDVEAILAEAEHLVAQTGARLYLPDIHLARAELARLAGDEAARRRELSEAHRLFTEMGATVRAEQVAQERAPGPRRSRPFSSATSSTRPPSWSALAMSERVGNWKTGERRVMTSKFSSPCVSWLTMRRQRARSRSSAGWGHAPASSYPTPGM